MIHSSRAYLQTRQSGLRRKFGFQPTGGIPVCVAVDVAMASQSARLQGNAIDLEFRTRLLEGVRVTREMDAGLERHAALAAELVDPKVSLTEMGMSIGVQALVTPLARHIEAGGAYVDGLSGPGSHAMRVEFLAEIDRPERLFQAALDAGHTDTNSLEYALARLMMPEIDSPKAGSSVISLQRITKTPVTDHMRLAAARRALTEDHAPSL
ncbi:hypothetical protein KUV57_13355 [Epibacterium sp. DP7N7-1]|nr:hypothetical protein [Epibacterium sp. DP7N7-1]